MIEDGQRLSLRVADRIQELRHEQGKSLDALAEATGLHATSIGLIVRGKRGMTLATATALSAALGVKLSDVIAHAEGRRS
ncbi:MAG: helix-turn-helix transcriptional regulator [Mycobacteriales bacterium]|nr:helix-turn-helix transcriptional regulator [Mycobacteriales bacterium]